MNQSFTKQRRGRGPLLRWALGLAVLTPLAACDDILEVDDVDVLRPAQLADSTAFSALRAGAIFDFANAYDDAVLLTGSLTDEFYNTDTFNTRQEIDRRSIDLQNPEVNTFFRNLQRARAAAELAAERFGAASPAQAKSPARAEVFNLAGFSYILSGENFCSFVPFSRVLPSGEFEFGEALSTREIFQRALARFDSALAITNNANQVRLASIGRARALTNLGRPQEAAAAVAGIPINYRYLIEYSDNTPNQFNDVYSLTINRKGFSVASNQGNRLPFREAGLNVALATPPATADPRVRFRPLSTGVDRSVLHFGQQLYPERGSPIALATGAEARYIEAEAALLRNDIAGFREKLNDVRRSIPGLPVLAESDIPGTREGQVDLLFRERAFTLYLTAHRLGDLRRLVTQYGRAPESVYPVGPYTLPARGGGEITIGTFGNDLVLPVPFNEQNNPLFAKDKDKCVTTSLQPV